jgi:hypothetical protein
MQTYSNSINKNIVIQRVFDILMVNAASRACDNCNLFQWQHCNRLSILELRQECGTRPFSATCGPARCFSLVISPFSPAGAGSRATDRRMSETSSVRTRGRRGRATTPVDAMEEDGGTALLGPSVRPQLRCNACWEPILTGAQSAETCYRTTCSHLFCVRRSLLLLGVCINMCLPRACARAGKMRVQALWRRAAGVPSLQLRCVDLASMQSPLAKANIDVSCCRAFALADLNRA